MPRLTPVDPAQAEGKAKTLLDGVQKKLGVVPNLFRTMVASPAVLESYLGFSQALGGTGLTARQREQIALAVAGASDCDYCASAHTAIGKGLGLSEGEATRNLQGGSEDPATAAYLDFATALVEKRGLVSDADLAAVRAAGADDAAIGEIVATVALNIFTNYFNHVAETEIDFPVVEVSSARSRSAQIASI